MAAARKKEPEADKAQDGKKEPEADKAQDGVFVAVHRNPDGGVATGVQLVGDVKVTEIQTILELARKAFRAEVGLDA